MMRRRQILSAALAALTLPLARAGLADQPAAEAQTEISLPRILAFGDSLTEGFGLSKRDGMLPELAHWLRRHGHQARLMNAGLSGDTTYGGRVRIGWSLRQGADAVIVELGANDLLMGWEIREIERNLDTIITRAKTGGRPVLLVGIAPPATEADPKAAEIRAMWTRLAERHKILLIPDLYAPIWDTPKEERAALLQKDGLHLSAKGVDLVVERLLGPAVLLLLGEIPPKRR